MKMPQNKHGRLVIKLSVKSCYELKFLKIMTKAWNQQFLYVTPNKNNTISQNL